MTVTCTPFGQPEDASHAPRLSKGVELHPKHEQSA
jgi:hypothetical protein